MPAVPELVPQDAVPGIPQPFSCTGLLSLIHLLSLLIRVQEFSTVIDMRVS